MLGSICGAFKGIHGVSPEWVQIVQRAIDANGITMQKLSMRDTAVGLTEAVLGNLTAITCEVQELGDLQMAPGLRDWNRRAPEWGDMGSGWTDRE